MSIVDVCVKDILKRFPLNSEGELLGMSWPDWLDAELDNMGPEPAAVMEEGTEVLGHYEPMASPGRIVLHREELASFFWHQARKIFRAGYHVEANDLQRVYSWPQIYDKYKKIRQNSCKIPKKLIY